MGPALMMALALWGPPYETADEALVAGQAHYRAREFDQAARALERAYQLEPRPEFLYAWAQAERFAGDCRQAVALYEQYLATDPPDASAEEARANVRTCATELAAAPEPPPPQPSPVPPPRAEPARPTPQPWHRDPLGGVLLGVGSAAAVTGIGLRVGAESIRSDAGDAAIHSGYDDGIRRSQRVAVAGIAVMATGAALLVGATIRYILVVRRNKQGGRWARGR